MILGSWSDVSGYSSGACFQISTSKNVTVRNCGVLPITLLDFNGKLNHGDVDLFWATSNEINNDYFYH